MAIEVVQQSITSVPDVEHICNAANGVGVMGAGVAGAIRRAAGADIQTEAMLACAKFKPKPGELYVTSAGKLPYKSVIHLVTMQLPGGPTSLEVVENCLHNLIAYCTEQDIKKVALPALGTGVGRLNKKSVANMYKTILTNSDIMFLVADIDEDFIKYMQK